MFREAFSLFVVSGRRHRRLDALWLGHVLGTSDVIEYNPDDDNDDVIRWKFVLNATFEIFPPSHTRSLCTHEAFNIIGLRFAGILYKNIFISFLVKNDEKYLSCTFAQNLGTKVLLRPQILDVIPAGGDLIVFYDFYLRDSEIAEWS